MLLRLFTHLALLLAALPAQHEILLGTWNIEFLGADPKFRRDTKPRDAQDLRAIGRRIRELGVAVLGVQEICGERPLREVAQGAGPTWRYVLGTTGRWSDGKTQQAVGLLYDTAAIDLLYAEELLDFPSELEGVSVFHRKPVTACLRHRASGCDFRIVVVHLKAGRKDRDRKKRRAEATALRDYFDSLQRDRGEDQDIVILGDFNSTYGDPPERILTAGDAMQFVAPRKPQATIVHFDSAIDHFCVGRDFAELRRDSLRVHGADGERERARFRATYSDHFPVTVALRASGDDDPEATFRHGPPTQVLPVTRRRQGIGASPSTTGGAWPPAVGAELELKVGKRTIRGTLALPLPREQGWVVVTTAQGTTAVPMSAIDALELRR